MRAITVKQPWAWAITDAGKDVENRTRNLPGTYRGEIAIHAGKTPDPGAYYLDLIAAAAAAHPGTWATRATITGAIVGVADLWATHLAQPGCCPNRGAAPFGSPWAQPDCWHLALTDQRPLPTPIPCRGALGLWTVPTDLEAQIRAQLAA